MIAVFEIGSTTTLVHAFDGLDTHQPRMLGSGQAATTVEDGDVTIGLKNALKDMEKNHGLVGDYEHLYASSSAAGGLIMAVSGLVHEMTVKAAREAALGAGANLKLITSGLLRDSDVSKLVELNPNIILLAGGVDYGERDTVLHNAKKILEGGLRVPTIYAGNIENHEEIGDLFKEYGAEKLLTITENVYPAIDQLNVEPTRKIIQEVFEEHIIHAPGMETIRDMIDENIIPTPGAVMLATELFYEAHGDVITFDVGGATTDVHSVTEGSEEMRKISIAPEPKAKRTVEGDLGLYVNRENVIKLADREELKKALGVSEEELMTLYHQMKPIPIEPQDKALVYELTKVAVYHGLIRHAGGLKDLFYTSGKKSIAMGKDLTSVKHLIGTGGALTQLHDTKDILRAMTELDRHDKLLPGKGAMIHIDKDYILAPLGVLSKKHPEVALKLIEESLGVDHVSKTDHQEE